MKTYYSAAARGFYDDLHENRPEDCVEISQTLHAELLEGQSTGLVIVPDKNGRPILDNPPPPTHEELICAARNWRNRELARSDIELLKVQDGVGTGTVSAWRGYRIALRNWPENPNFPDSTKRPVAPDVV